jgi:outer membrane protein TolC
LDTDGGASAGLSLDVLVYDFGRNSARAKAAAENLVSSELSLLNAGYDVFGEVASAYFTVLEKDALLEVAYTNEYECALQLEQAEALFESGEGQQLDVLRSRLDLAEAKEALAYIDANEDYFQHEVFQEHIAKLRAYVADAERITVNNNTRRVELIQHMQKLENGTYPFLEYIN